MTMDRDQQILRHHRDAWEPSGQRLGQTPDRQVGAEDRADVVGHVLAVGPDRLERGPIVGEGSGGNPKKCGRHAGPEPDAEETGAIGGRNQKRARHRPHHDGIARAHDDIEAAIGQHTVGRVRVGRFVGRTIPEAIDERGEVGRRGEFPHGATRDAVIP